MRRLSHRLVPGLVLVVALLALAAPTAAQEKSVRPGINKPFANPNVKEYLEKFEGESREIFTSRKEIVAAVGLRSGMAVADIGAGTGLFTRLFAKEVGPTGKVYAVDIAQRFIEHIEKTSREQGLKNVVGVVCKPDSVELPENSIDLAFICDTYHHFEFPFRTMTSLHRALRPGGQVVLIDFHRIPGTSSEWILNHVRAGQEVVTQEVVSVGYKLLDEKKFLKENYFLRFQKTGPDRDPAPGEWGYRPADRQPTAVNPPALTWVHDPAAATYTVQWASGSDFRDATSVDRVRWCVYTHYEPLPPGDYVWRYRVDRRDGSQTDWSRPRRFTVPANAVTFPKPTLPQLQARIPREHPRLFFRPEELPAVRAWAQGDGRRVLDELRQKADQLLRGEPTPEPTVRGTIRDPQTRTQWWPNRERTLKACQEAETLALVYLLTGTPRYGEGARRWILHLASWDPDGPTNFTLNCEAAKPLLHRLPRAYDWAYDALTPADRRRVQDVMRRRAADAWRNGEVREGNGHLNQPYNSHGNRVWHKLAECALAFHGELEEADTWLDYAVNKFYAAYPVWSDDDGGWHEGLSYWSGYLTKTVWWTEVADKALGIDSFRKPFFAHVGDYPLYVAPPGSPDMGFGDLSYRPPSSSWGFVHYYARKTHNPYLVWWADQHGMRFTTDDPVQRLVWARLPPLSPQAPDKLPPSKVFPGIGVAVLNATLRGGADNVQLRFKASPFGRQSHGHDPHNSFTLAAHGDALLVNCVYRDWHGSPFHTKWCWSTGAHNALLVNGQGQKPHSPDPLGRIAAWDFQEGADYLAGDAADAYQGKLRRFRRHVVYARPDVIVLADELEAAQPSTFQWMLHGLSEFQLDPGGQTLQLERDRAGLLVHYIAPESLSMRQRHGFEPPPDAAYLGGTGRSGFPEVWHAEAATLTPRDRLFVLTVLRPYRKGQRLESTLALEQNDSGVLLRVPLADGTSVRIGLRKPGAQEAVVGDLRFTHAALVQRGERRWLLGAP